MNSMERFLAAVTHKQPDRAPLFLFLSIYGANELQLTVKEYFNKPENIVEAQLRMKKKFNNDCIDTFFYAPIEIEAMGGEVVFYDNAPPNSGEPLIKSFEQISSLNMPVVKQSPQLKKVLDATSMIKSEVSNTTPIIGVVMSPFSLPVMQLGFEKYLEMLYSRPDDFQKLMQINEDFCVEWANAQLEAGATAICYFDPLASPNIIEKETYLKTGNIIAKRTIARINGPTATHLASGITLPVIDDIVNTGTAVIGFSANDDLEQIKKASKNKICLLGNLNALDMINWDDTRIENEIKNIFEKAGEGGGLIIADNHGEIPFQTPENILFKISEAVEKFCKY